MPSRNVAGLAAAHTRPCVSGRPGFFRASCAGAEALDQWYCGAYGESGRVEEDGMPVVCPLVPLATYPGQGATQSDCVKARCNLVAWDHFRHDWNTWWPQSWLQTARRPPHCL